MIKTNLLIAILFSVQYIFGQQLTILHTNDLHSKITGTGPEFEYSPLIVNNDNTVGGFARLATIFKQQKENFPESTLILDAGDFLMGSLFHAAEEETGFQTSLMHKMGYDFITLGNHEFDFGPEILANIINTARENGEIPQILASNLVFSKNSKEDDQLQQLFSDGIMQPYSIIVKNGLKIGLFGIMGEDAASVSPASKPVTFSNPVKEARKMAHYLKEKEKADIVILLSHCGLNYEPVNNLPSGEDIGLAKKVPEIDIIIGGHSHTATPKFIKTGNTFIVQTGSYGTNAGKIRLNFSGGKITDFGFELIPVNDKVEGDSEVQSQIEELINHLDNEILAETGLKFKQIVGTSGFDLTMDFPDLKNSNLGPFVADASLFYMKHTGNEVDFSIVATGIIRANLLSGEMGKITVPDIFNVMSLGKGADEIPGYPLAKIYITGHEVKKLMEALIISREKGGDGFIYFSGIKTWIDSNKGFLKKVQKIEINGTEIDLSKKNNTLYSFSANTYLASFIGRIKKMTFGLVKVVPKNAFGIAETDIGNQVADVNPDKEGIQEAKEWIAITEFLKSFEKNGEGYPAIPASYKNCKDSVIDLAR